MTGTLSAKSYLTNLMAKAKTSTDYDSLDCSAYTLWARNNKGYSGSTTDFCQHTKYYGYISDLGGYNMLLPGMHLYQAWKHENGKYTTEHVAYTRVAMISETALNMQCISRVHPMGLWGG